jgi:ATP-dependent Lhr-like helicase
LAQLLRHDYQLQDVAIAVLVDFFQRQECVSEIPDIGTCLIEAVDNGFGVDYYFHTPLNRAGNDTLARVAVARLARHFGQSATSLVADLGFLLSLRAQLTPEVLRDLLSTSNFDADLAQAVDDSWSLRERFHGVALTGLMLLRNPLGGRRRVGGRDWAERRLFDKVRAIDPDFVLLRQARREVDSLVLDGAAARQYLEELAGRTFRWRWLADISPFAESWTHLAAGPAESVESPSESLRRLHAALMASVEA